MRVFLSIALAIIFAAATLTGCVQKQEAAKKQIVVKPSSAATESANTEEESDTEENATDAASAPKVVEPAPHSSAVEELGPQVPGPALKVVDISKPETSAAQKSAEELVIADFDSGDKPSNLGSNFGAWNKDPSDATQWCKESFDNVTKHGDKGFSMKLDYSVASQNPAYNGFWMMLPNFDASKYDNLTLWVKGDAKEGFTTVFKVEVKNAAKQIGRFYISNVSDQWQEVVIPLSEFKGLTDRSNLTEVVIVFEDRMASNKKGVIYVDDFKFTKNR